MKPKLDWISQKFQSVERILPDGTALMVLAIYNLARQQRNELGHPTDKPPKVSLIEARARLQLFPPFCIRAQQLCKQLTTLKL